VVALERGGGLAGVLEENRKACRIELERRVHRKGRKE